MDTKSAGPIMHSRPIPVADYITRAVGAADESVRAACRAAVITAMDIIEGRAPWAALSPIAIGMASEDADRLLDRLYALRAARATHAENAADREGP